MYYDHLFVEANLPNPLNQEEIYTLFKKMMAGDLNAREEIIKHNIRLVLNIVVKNFSNSPYDQKELVSIGIIGLIKSVDSFDISKKLQFATYATRCIQNEILMFMRKGKKYIFNESLNKPLTTDKDGHEYKVEDTIEDISSDFVTDYENKEVYKIIRQIVENLNERDSLITKLHFGFETGNPISQKEIAKSLGISQSYVSRIIKNVLKKISRILQKQGLIELSQKVEITKKEKYPINLENQKINEIQTSSQEVSYEEYIKTIELLKTPNFTQLLQQLSPTEAIVAYLKLGFIDEKYFSTSSIADFLGIDVEKVVEITRKVLLMYKENLNEYIIDFVINFSTNNDNITK